MKDALIGIFDLQKVPEVPELSSIKNVRWGIAYYCKHISKYPLWSLKYFNEINETMCQLIEQIVEMVHKEDTQPEQIKRVLKSIQESKFELQKLLLNKVAFKNGFINFVGSIDSVSMEENWWTELFDYLSLRMPNEIGWWKESDVESKVKDFYITKISPTTSVFSPVQNDSGYENENGNGDVLTIKPETPVKQISSVPLEEVQSVRNRITQVNMPTPALKWILVQVLDNFPETVDIINDNLN